MAATIAILGIRHHGPGSARMLLAALERLAPDTVLIEAPSDMQESLAFVAHEALVPPVAVLLYDEETPSDAIYLPYAEFSPEWQAMRFAAERSIPTMCIDLPFALRGAFAGTEESTEAERGDAGTDPLDALAAAASEGDGERWWERLIEERADESDALGAFEAIARAMAEVRADVLPDRETALREAHMRRAIRTAMKEGKERIAVVCGAYHAPVLDAAALKRFPVGADNELLKGHKRRSTIGTWIPWTNGRLAAASGYRAGIRSPGWYEHLWRHRSQVAAPWMARVARLLRERDLGGAPAQSVDAVRLAETLAALRGRAAPGLAEMNDAALATLCAGNDVPLRVVERELVIGERLGTVPDSAPTVPLARDVARWQKSLRLPVTADDREIELDLRKDHDREKGHLFRRLRLLDVPWAQAPSRSAGGSGTFRERWRLQWMPEFSVRIIERARFGSTVERAASAAVIAHAASERSLASLIERLNDVLHADVPEAADALVRRIGDLTAGGGDVTTLLSAVGPMATVLRYGDVRETSGQTLLPLLTTMLRRALAGLAPACRQVSEERATELATLFRETQRSLVALAVDGLLAEWEAELGELAASESAHALLVGSANRMLLDRRTIADEAVAARMALWLSPGGDGQRAAAWLEGFLADGGAVLVHDAELRDLVDGWIVGLPRERFEALLPILRRTFAHCSAAESRRLGAAIAASAARPGATVVAADRPSAIDIERARRVVPALATLLGTERETLERLLAGIAAVDAAGGTP